MSQYTVKVLVEALDRPSTMKALRRKTGLDMGQLVSAMLEARAAGHRIIAHQRAGDRSYYTLEVNDGTND